MPGDLHPCPTCGVSVTVLPSGFLAHHYAHGPGMGIACPPAQPPAPVAEDEP